ncbi:hypothetical protein Dip510_000690 [Elusimicrobium posterum]|uniref:hypothetical protein n=1 Tax=Elusimicrobium posterum TaxID=3116653 RepID=UPI003C73E7BA
MSKLSYFFIFIIIACIAVLGGYRANQYYNSYTQKANERLAAKREPSVFTQITPANIGVTPQSAISVIPADINELAMAPVSAAMAPQITEGPLGDSPLHQLLENNNPDPIIAKVTDNEETRSEAARIFSKYSERPIIKAFNQDLRKAGLDNLDLSSVNGPEFAKTIQNNPQIQMLLLKYAQNPEFVAVLQEMATDPEVQKVTKQIRKEHAN